MTARMNHSFMKLNAICKGSLVLLSDGNNYGICSIRFYIKKSSAMCTQIACLMISEVSGHYLSA